MRHTRLALSLAASLIIGAAVGVRADDSAPLPSVLPSEISASSMLGQSFENQSAGIALQIPRGCHRVRSNGSGDDLGQFADEKLNWQVKLTRIIREQPTSLATANDNFSKPVSGLLDQTVEGLRRAMPGCQILRSDLTNVRDGDPSVKDNVGMIAVRYGAAGAHFLTQQAIIQSTDRLFYLLALTSPGSEASGDAADSDPAERSAVETFRQMLDSVRLLDTRTIAEDQRDRLIRTRALMVNWTARRLHEALVPEQWVRILRDGKDVGYSYITEQTAAGVPRPLRLEEVKAGMSDAKLILPGDGLLIGVRARSLARPTDVDPNIKSKEPLQIDSATWMFVTPDRRLEDWSRIIVADTGTVDKDGKPVRSQAEELGSSNHQVIRAFDKDGMLGTRLDPKQPALRVRERYSLDVTTVSQSGQGDPVNQDLPGWYLPQALSHLLPRLVPLQAEFENGKQKTRSYLFAVYVPETREVMHRYIDVGDEQTVTLLDRTFRAIPIRDRIGWNGSVTIHYMSPQGVYLGSENKDAHEIMIPSDSQSLLAVWKDAKLTQPDAVTHSHGLGTSIGPSEPSSLIPAQELPGK